MAEKKKEESTYQPFHIRHRQLLITCCATGLFTYAYDRTVKPGIKRNFIFAWGMFGHFILFIFLLSNFSHFLLGESLISMLHDLLIVGCGVHGCIRQLYMHIKRKEFDDLWVSWDELFGHDEDAEERRRFIKKNADAIIKKLIRLGILSTICLGVFVGMSYASKDKVVKIPTAIPYRHQSPDFEIVMTVQTLGVYFFTVAVTATQFLILLPIIWISSELERLKLTLATILREADAIRRDAGEYQASDYTEKGMLDIYKKLKVWVKNHQKILIYHQKAVDVMNFQFSIEMLAAFVESVSCACILPGNYLTIEEKISATLGFGTYNRFFYNSCDCCSQLVIESQRVFDYGFAENWTALPTKLKKDLYIIAMRTMKPLCFIGTKIMRFDVECYNKIVQTAYSVFSFAVTVISYE